MKNKFLPLVLLLTFAAAVSLSAQDMAVATVRLEKTEPISGKQLQQTVSALETQQGRTFTTEEKKAVLKQLIDQVLIIQAAEADRAISVTPEEVQQAGMRLLSQQLQSIGAIPPGAVLTDKNQYRQVIEQQGISVADYEKTVRNQILAEKYITSRDQAGFQSIGKATETEINNEYQKRVSEFVVSDSVWFNHIFFETKGLAPADVRAKQTKAADVQKRLMNTGVTFASLVASESEDQASKARGGLIGPLMKGDYVAEQLYGPDFIDSVFKLDVGAVSDVLKSNVGYHIVKISEKRAAQLLPKEDPEVRAYLEQIIYASKYQRKFDEVTRKVIAELEARATINYFGEYR
jgi:parvulin-like peptidyl-prolyl isomerase